MHQDVKTEQKLSALNLYCLFFLDLSVPVIMILFITATFIWVLTLFQAQDERLYLPKVTWPVLAAKKTGAFARAVLHSGQLLHCAARQHWLFGQSTGEQAPEL